MVNATIFKTKRVIEDTELEISDDEYLIIEIPNKAETSELEAKKSEERN